MPMVGSPSCSPGGTISMGFDPVAGGNVPTLDGAAILARTPGLESIADVVPIDRGLTPASHFTFADLLGIGGVIQDALDDPAIDGVVVVQGTDTIEETAFAWDLSCARRSRWSSPARCGRRTRTATTDRRTCAMRSRRPRRRAARRGRGGVPGRHDRGCRRRDQDAHARVRHVPVARTGARSGGWRTTAWSLARPRGPRRSWRRAA